MLREAFAGATWLFAAAWCWRIGEAHRHLGEIPDLSQPEWNVAPGGEPSLVVVVPARDEEVKIAETLTSLLASDYRNLQIVAVDDRSLDATGAILESISARMPERIQTLRIAELPEGWLGKTWALETAVRATRSDWLLFTDADVSFKPAILGRAVAYAEREGAVHLVVAPTPLVKSHGEGMVLGFFQVFGVWTSRPWRVRDPKAKHDVVGVGAFNLVRRSALEQIGGLAPQRMTVLEDMTLGRRIKGAGLPQRVASAPHMVELHWAAGARGLVRVLTKNLYSSVNFRAALLLLVVTWVLLFGWLPVAGLFWRPTLVPALLMCVFVAMTYRRMEPITGIAAKYAWVFPVGALAFAWALLRSMLAAWARGGVVWRGTHYPLRQMRRYNSPFQWR